MSGRIDNARKLKDLLSQREKVNLSPLACYSHTALRRHTEKHNDDEYRQPFSADADRILNSLAYTRYIDKTQVFSLIKNDHLTHRVLHVQLVSRVARTIGRYLGLNEDLIEAGTHRSDTTGSVFFPSSPGKAGPAFFIIICKASSFWTGLKRMEKAGI